MIAPKVEEMAVGYKGKGVRFAKVDCGKTDANKKCECLFRCGCKMLYAERACYIIILSMLRTRGDKYQGILRCIDLGMAYDHGQEGAAHLVSRGTLHFLSI